MKSHIEVGRRYPEITINTTYSFGLDDQEFVVASRATTRASSSTSSRSCARPSRASTPSARPRSSPAWRCRSRKALDALDGTAAAPSRAERPGARLTRRRSLFFRAPMSKIGTEENPLRVAIVGAGPSGFYAAEHILKDERPARPGRPLRPPPDPVRAGPRRRRPRPPEDQVGDPRLRENRGPRGLPLLRQRQGRPRHRGRGPRAPLPRDRLHGRLRDRPPARHPRRGPARQPRRHRLRRLVQRPPRLRRRRVRPLLRARGGDRQRQRGDGRRPDAGPHRPRAAPDRHRRPRDRGCSTRKQIREIVVLGRRGPVQAAFTNPEIKELGEMEDADVDRRPRRGRARPGQRRPSSSPTRPTRRPGSTSRRCSEFSAARARGQAAADRPALPRLAGRDQGRRQGRDRS